MKDFKSWLKPENIHLNLTAESELEAIRTMLEFAENDPVVINIKQLAQSMFDNEILSGSHRECSGITFHALSNAVIEPQMLLGRFEKGIGYYSKKIKPIDFVVLMVAPRLYEQQFKKMVLSVKDLLCDSELMEIIRDIDNQNEIYQLFLNYR